MGEKNLSISFVIPTFNAGLYIRRCLESIRSQGYPPDKIEILILDGGSSDDTVSIAKNYGCKIIENKKQLAEYGVQLGIANAHGDLSVIFAADNELVGNDWLNKVIAVFNSDKEISAVWGKLASGTNDACLNKYFALIQSDPLSWFLNSNLKKYLRRPLSRINNFFVFSVDPKNPLIWGANGLVYRTDKIRDIWLQEGYLGDNDAFQYMVEKGSNRVAYTNSPFVFHHHVAKLGDWARKWRRNFSKHFLDKRETRNMNWAFSGNYKLKLFFWSFYSAIPVFSFIHSIYLVSRDRSIYWLYHPLASFLQFYTYMTLVFFTPQGRGFLKSFAFKRT